jgi:lysozyme family protein
MGPNFQKAVDRLFANSRAYINHPAHLGREAAFGLSGQIIRKHGYEGEVCFLPEAKAREIYEKEYWLPLRADEIPYFIAFPLFECAVSSGPPLAIRLFQQSIGLPLTGDLTPETFTALKYAGPLITLNFIQSRQLFHQSLPSWPAYGKDWTNRNFLNAKFLLEDIL